MPSQIDDTVPVLGNPTTLSVRNNFTTAKQEITALQNVAAAAPFLPLAGAHMTGPMYLWNDPTDGRMPATKDYVDAHSSGGGGGLPEAPPDGATYGRNSGAWQPVVPLTGNVTMTGLLTLSGPPTANLHAATKAYVDTTVGAAAFVPIAGATMTGLLTLSGPPTANLHAATKAYVDTGLAPKAPLASPVFSGTPTSTTPPVGTTSAQIATCGFVSNGFLPLSGGNLSGALVVNGSINAAGPNSSLTFTDHGSGLRGRSWSWYAQADVARLNEVGGVGDVLTINYQGMSVTGAINSLGTTAQFTWADAAGYPAWQLSANAGNVYFSSNGTSYLTLATSGGLRITQNYLWFANNGSLVAQGGGPFIEADPSYMIFRHGSTGAANAQWLWQNADPATVAYLQTGGNFWIVGATAWKLGGGTWTDYSDRRLKRDIEPYSAGLDEIDQLNPVRFRFNGLSADRPDDGREFIGLVADDVQSVMPEMVGTLRQRLRDDTEPTDILTLDATALTYALVNAVKQLRASVRELESKAKEAA